MANIQHVDFQAYVKQLIAETINSDTNERQGSKIGRPTAGIESRPSNKQGELGESHDE